MPLAYKLAFRIATDLGYKLSHQKGSHQQFVRDGYPVTIPTHTEFSIGTAKSIIKRLATGAHKNVKEIIDSYKIKF